MHIITVCHYNIIHSTSSLDNYVTVYHHSASHYSVSSHNVAVFMFYNNYALIDFMDNHNNNNVDY